MFCLFWKQGLPLPVEWLMNDPGEKNSGMPSEKDMHSEHTYNVFSFIIKDHISTCYLCSDARWWHASQMFLGSDHSCVFSTDWINPDLWITLNQAPRSSAYFHNPPVPSLVLQLFKRAMDGSLDSRGPEMDISVHSNRSWGQEFVSTKNVWISIKGS